MQDHCSSSPAVVVGIDGSRSAVDAALWAVDEAVSRDIPLRLVYAIDPDDCTGTDPQDAARDLASRRNGRQARVHGGRVDGQARQDRGRDPAERADAARCSRPHDGPPWSCVGSMGLKHSAHGRIGSTAAALASSAHCPVAVVRGHDPLRAKQQWVVAEVDESAASDGVLRRALEEAQLRGAPLRVLTTWQSRFTDIHDGNAVADGNRLAKAQLDRRLAQWKKRYPDLDVQRGGRPRQHLELPHEERGLDPAARRRA